MDRRITLWRVRVVSDELVDQRAGESSRKGPGPGRLRIARVAQGIFMRLPGSAFLRTYQSGTNLRGCRTSSQDFAKR